MSREGVYLFTGPEGYFLQQELNKWQKGFAEKFGDNQCITFTNDSVTLPLLQEALQGGGLFSSKKMIICKGIPDDKAGSGKAPIQIVGFLESLFSQDTRTFSPDVILIFVSLDPDKRLKLFKMLSEKANIKSFPSLNENKMTDFIQKQLGQYYTRDIQDYLVSYVGDNLFRIEQECNKISAYMQYTKQTTLQTSDMENIVYTPIQVNAFAVLDALASGDIQTMLTHIDASAQNQTAWPEFIGMLYRGIKHMLQTVYLHQDGTKQAKDIASAIGIHFFPIVKNLKYIEHLTTQKTSLENIFHELLLLDKDIKSGSYPAEGFRAAIQKILTSHTTKI